MPIGEEELEKLVAEIDVRHGIRIGLDDPAVAFIRLNQLLLEQTAAALLKEVRRAIKQLDQSAEAVQARAGAALAGEVQESAAAIRKQIQSDLEGATIKARALVRGIHRAHEKAAGWHWSTLGLFAAVLLFMMGFAVGRFTR
jgi:hypothetical protein